MGRINTIVITFVAGGLGVVVLLTDSQIAEVRLAVN